MTKPIVRVTTCVVTLLLLGSLGAQIRLVKDIGPKSKDGAPLFLEELNGILYFLAKPEPANRSLQLWASDGTEAGTVQIDVPGLPERGSASDFVKAEDKLFFTISNAGTQELWVSDGTGPGTRRLYRGGSYEELTAWGNTLAFSNHDGVHGRELWFSDGTVSGTSWVTDIWPGIIGSEPDNVTAYGDVLLFVARTDPGVRELWRLDRGGALSMINVNDDPLSSHPSGLTVFDGRVFFAASNKDAERELYVTDGRKPGTGLFKDLAPMGGSSPQKFAVTGRLMFFWAALSPATGLDLWVTDGTLPGTKFVKEVIPGLGDVFPLDHMGRVGNRLLFDIKTGNGIEYWVSDGTAVGTVLLKDISQIGNGNANPRNPVPVGNGSTLFTASDGNGMELWRTDGVPESVQPGGTFLVEDLWVGPASSTPSDVTQVGGKVFFAARTQTLGSELFCYDLGSTGVSIGHGCADGGLSPVLEVTDPVIGTDLEFTGRLSPVPSTGVLYLGFPTPGKPFFIAPGCAVYMDPNREVAPVLGIPVQDPTWMRAVPVPNDFSLVGLEFVGQTVYLRPAMGIVFELSNAVYLNVGS